MPDIPELKHEDFELTFEAKGHTLLFEDLVLTNYLPGPGIVSFVRGVARVFVRKSVLEAIEKIPEAELASYGNRHIDALKRSINMCLEYEKSFDAQERFDEKSYEHALGKLEVLMKDYCYIDTWYTNSLYENGNPRATAVESINVIQAYKNSLRAGDIEHIFFARDGYLEKLLFIISKQSDIPSQDLQSYRISELKDLVTNKISVSSDDLKRREQAYVLASGLFLSGSDAEEWMDIFLKEPANETFELRGIVAHGKGQVVRGRVFVADTFPDLSVNAASESFTDMRKGDILVLPVTDARLVGVYEKAAAVVTDIGGMLSHAAIVARELAIPCIVGTKNASKVLKTGDMVEIDADKGIVRILG